MLIALLALGLLYAAAADSLGLYWRGLAALTAVLLLVIVVIRVRRTRRLSTVFLAVQVLAIPEGGLIAFAGGTAVPSRDVLVPLGVFVLAWELSFGVLLIIFARWRASRKVLTLRSLDRASHRAALARTTVLVAMGGALLVLAPWWGVANLVANAAWVCVCIPRRWRLIELVSATEVQAALSRVFDVMSDPAKWALYRDDLEVTSVDPPGRLARGTRYVVRLVLPTDGRSPRQSHIEIEQVVTDFVPDRSITSRALERAANTATVQVEPTPSGTLLTVGNRATLSFSEAFLGLRLDLPMELAAYQAVAHERHAGLKLLLEEPVTSV